MNAYMMLTKIQIICFSFLLIQACRPNIENDTGDETPAVKPAYALVIHGGAGTITKENMTPEKEKMYRLALQNALKAGEQVLKNGGSALEAVSRSITSMEDSPLFNAGKGAVFTHEGTNEMDASIMVGSTLDAGAVAGVKTVKNPILGAIAVMEKSPHVLLAGSGADKFCQSIGLQTQDPDYFKTRHRWNSLQRALKNQDENKKADVDEKHGTVGAVALDRQGHIVAGTSTGGMTNKRWNRIGDSPIIGAGTYADDNTCGVSCTGHGEYFIRYAVAHDIAALIQYKDMNARQAGDQVINNKLKVAGGTGGAIIIDHKGNIAMPFNTKGMYRGYAKPDETKVFIYK